MTILKLSKKSSPLTSPPPVIVASPSAVSPVIALNTEAIEQPDAKSGMSAPVIGTVPLKEKPAIDTVVDALINPSTKKGVTSPIKASLGGVPSSPGKMKVAPGVEAPLLAVAGEMTSKAREFDVTRDDVVIQSVTREHRNFSVLGDLTGLSAQRPNIIAVTNFVPTLRDTPIAASVEVPLTRMGRYILEQYYVRTLVSENVQNLIKNFKTASPGTRDALNALMGGSVSKFTNTFWPVSELMSALNALDALKRAFEFKRYEDYVGVDIAGGLMSSVKTSLQSKLATSVRLSDLFTGDLGFSEQAFRSFTNTKVLFQLLYELQHVVKNHSYDLVKFDSTAHERDDSSIAIVKNTTVSPKYSVGFMERFKTLSVTVNSLNDLYAAKNTDALLKSVNDAITLIVAELPTTIPDRIALLSSIISKEYRMSAGLANPDFVNRLSVYGFTTTGERTVIDQLVGDIPDRVTQVVTSQPKGSMSNILQVVDGDVAVLPFEQKYIDSENGVFTPGSSYFVDSILDDPAVQFNVSRLEKYEKTLKVAVDAFSDVMKSLELSEHASYAKNGANRSDIFFIRMLSGVICATFTNGDLSAGTFGQVNDVLLAMLSLSYSDKVLKGLLFTLFLSYEFVDNTPTSILHSLVTKKQINFHSDIVNRMIERAKFVLNAVYGGGGSSSSSEATKFESLLSFDLSSYIDMSSGTPVAGRGITDEEIRAAMSSDQFRKVLRVFKDTYDDFVARQCVSGGTTRFSKVPVLAVRFLIFELMLGIATRFGFTHFKSDASGVLKVYCGSTKMVAYKLFTEKLVVVPDVQKALNTDFMAEADSFDPQIRTIARKLFDEENLIRKLFLAINGSVSSISRLARDITTDFRAGDGKYSKLFDQLTAIVSKKFIGLLDSAQIRLAVFQAIETAHAFLGGKFAFIENVAPSNAAFLSLGLLMSEKKFQQAKAENLRILSVGLPLGFSKQLQERIKLKNAKDKALVDTKQRDIVKVKVYKRDLEFPDLVFKPQEFLFELSRFVSPDLSFKAITAVPIAQTFDDVMQRVRTLNIEGNFTIEKFMSTVSEGSEIDTAQYNFLTSKQRREIVTNHVISSLLELYIKLATGVSLNEQAFLIDQTSEVNVSTFVDQNALKALIDEYVMAVTKVDNFDSSVDSIDALDISPKVREKLTHDLQHLGVLAMSRTTFSMPEAELRRALTPKAFDRIFHIAVDPDDFDIDIEKTNASESGSAMMANLVATGEVISIDEPSKSLSEPDRQVFRLNERNRKNGIVTLEQYFVTVETMLETST